MSAQQGISKSVQLTLSLTVCLSAFTIDIAIPAIPEIVDFYNAADSSGQKIIAIYLAGYAVGQIPIGLLSDRYGRMPIFYIGLVLFTLTSLATMLATSIEMLLWARFFQGISGASGPVLARAIARDLASGYELAKITALLVTALAVSTLMGPIFGSIIMALGDWRYIFAMSVLLGILCIAAIFAFVPETHKIDRAHISLLKQFSDSTKAFRNSPASIWGLWLVSLTYFAYMSIVAGISQVLVDIYSMSVVSVGFVFGGAILFYIASAQYGRKLLGKYSSLHLTGWGFIGYGVSLVMLALIQWADIPNFWLFWWSLIPFLIGMGLIISNATAITLMPLPKSAGFAASILGTAQIAFAALGAMLTGLFYDRSLDSLIFVLMLGSFLALAVFICGLFSKRIRASIAVQQ